MMGDPPTAAAKNVIIPNAWTPVRLEWYSTTTTTTTAAAAAASGAKTNPKNIPTTTRRNNRHTTNTRSSGSSSSVVVIIHQTTHEDTWPGGAIWDLGWCMAQLILGLMMMMHGNDSNDSSDGILGDPRVAVHTTTTFDDDRDPSRRSHQQRDDDGPSQQQQCVQLHHTIQLPHRLVNLIRPVTTTTTEEDDHHPNIDPSFWTLVRLAAAGQQPSLPKQLPRRRHNHHRHNHTDDKNSTRTMMIVLELGAGTGLTGIVLAAAAATTNVTVLLTDLKVVVDQVTIPNVQRNIRLPSQQHSRTVTFPLPDRRPPGYQVDQNDHDNITEATPSRLHKVNMSTLPNHHGRLVALPLCWGDLDDMNVVQSLIRHLQHEHHQSPPPCESSQRQQHDATRTKNDDRRCPDGIPDLLIIGDVAYQHKPGAASHFDALLETILQLTNKNDNNNKNNGTTLILFGLRIRMPASRDLYDMLLQYFEDVIEPIVPHEIDPVRFPIHPGKSIHTMTIHLMKRRNDALRSTAIK